MHWCITELLLGLQANDKRSTLVHSLVTLFSEGRDPERFVNDLVPALHAASTVDPTRLDEEIVNVKVVCPEVCVLNGDDAQRANEAIEASLAQVEVCSSVLGATDGFHQAVCSSSCTVSSKLLNPHAARCEVT